MVANIIGMVLNAVPRKPSFNSFSNPVRYLLAKSYPEMSTWPAICCVMDDTIQPSEIHINRDVLYNAQDVQAA